MNTIIQTVKNAFIIVVLSGVIFVLCVILLPFLFIFGRKKASPFFHNIITTPLSRSINRFLFRCKIVIYGKENIPSRSVRHAKISNHLSFFDIPVLMDVLNSSFIMKKSVVYFFPYGTLAYILGGIPVKRYNLKDLKIVSEKMVERIRDGIDIHLFPEGTRSRNGDLLNFKKGLLHKLYKEKIPVLCAALWNTQKVFAPDNVSINKINFNEPVYVSVGKLIDPNNYDNFDIFFEACVDEVKTQLDKIRY